MTIVAVLAVAIMILTSMGDVWVAVSLCALLVIALVV